MTPKEDQQPMTTREELVALAENIEGSGRFSFTRDYILLPCLHKRDRDLVASALRLASRQEVSVEELALELMNARRRMTGLEELSAERVKKIGLWPLKEETMCAARALLAKYSITKRTTEG